MKLNYPSSEFMPEGLACIKKREDFFIEVSDKKKKELVNKQLPFLMDSQKVENKSDWGAGLRMWLLFNLNRLHFYAMAAGYVLSTAKEENGILLLNYQAHRNTH